MKYILAVLALSLPSAAPAATITPPNAYIQASGTLDVTSASGTMSCQFGEYIQTVNGVASIYGLAISGNNVCMHTLGAKLVWPLTPKGPGSVRETHVSLLLPDGTVCGPGSIVLALSAGRMTGVGEALGACVVAMSLATTPSMGITP